MEIQNLLKTKIGTIETKKLKPAKVKILGVEFQDKKKDGTIMKSALANILVKHPDKEEHIKISKIKCIRNEKIEIITLWVNLDENKQLEKSSAISDLLRFLNIESLEQIVGKEIEAIEQSKEDTYLCLKAY